MISLGNTNIKKISVGSGEIKKISLGTTTVWEDVYVAQDSDFVNVNGLWTYRGTELEVKIPHVIHGVAVTSYQQMFCGNTTHRATKVTRVVSDNPNVTNMDGMFFEFAGTTLDLSSFNTSNVTNMRNMFISSQVTTLDLSSFDTSKVTNTSYMFYNSQATTGYARTQADANKFNSSSNKPGGLSFVVKP